MADAADVEDYVYAFLAAKYPDFAKKMAAKVKRKLTAPEESLESVLQAYQKQQQPPPTKKAKSDSSSSSGEDSDDESDEQPKGNDNVFPSFCNHIGYLHKTADLRKKNNHGNHEGQTSNQV